MTKKILILLIALSSAVALCLLLTLMLLHRRSLPDNTQLRSTAPLDLQLPAVPESTASAVLQAVPPAAARPLPPFVQPHWAETLPQQLDSLLPETDDVWIVYVEGLNSGASAAAARSATADQPLVSASIVKLFIMAAVFDRIEQGILSDDDAGQDLMKMIRVSDNDAANRLIRLLGGGDDAAGRQAVNDYAQSIGCTQVRLNRLMMEQNGTENYVSVNDCATLLRMIYRGECVSKAASAEMLALLLSQHYRDYIPAKLPETVPIAHKGGDLRICQGDVGIVFAETEPYLVCIIENGSWSDSNTECIGKLSLCVYEAIAGLQIP